MSASKKTLTRPMGILVASALMILFGIAEIATGFTHSFFGITTSETALFTVIGAILGALYTAAGILILTLKKLAAALAILLLILDIIGRVSLVVTGLFPTNNFENLIGIIGGTSIAGIFAIFIGWKWKSFK
jgi:hypothetical protein